MNPWTLPAFHAVASNDRNWNPGSPAVFSLQIPVSSLVPQGSFGQAACGLRLLSYAPAADKFHVTSRFYRVMHNASQPRFALRNEKAPRGRPRGEKRAPKTSKGKKNSDYALRNEKLHRWTGCEEERAGLPKNPRLPNKKKSRP